MLAGWEDAKLREWYFIRDTVHDEKFVISTHGLDIASVFLMMLTTRREE